MKKMYGKLGKLILTGIFLFSPSQALASPINLSVVDGDLRAVLLSTARMGGFNLVLDDSVKGNVTLSLHDVEPEYALQLVAGAGNLLLERMGASYVVTGRGQQGSLLSAHAFPVSYANPEELRHSLEMALDRVGNISVNGSKDPADKDGESGTSGGETAVTGNRITVDPSTNTIVIYGTASEAERVGRLIRELDVPAKQVSLEAKVVSIDKSASKELGVEWEWSRLPQYPHVTKSYRTRQHRVTNSDGTSSIVYEDEPTVDVDRSGRTSLTPGIVQFGRGPEGTPFEFYYGAKLNALVTDGKAKILSRPNITTLQGHEAVINIGGSVPVPKMETTNSTTTTSIEYRQAGIILRYTPRVNADGFITADVHTEISTPLYVEDMKAYRFNNRSADTTVRLKDGDTMVIGGLIGSEEARSLSKVPILGDIPILGAFFRNQKTSKTDSEIMIFLTAKVL